MHIDSIEDSSLLSSRNQFRREYNSPRHLSAIKLKANASGRMAKAIASKKC